MVLDTPQPAVYCVPGRPATIVLTTGALAVLDEPQLLAVLAHEHAHLAGRHHLLVTLGKAARAGFPGVPLFTRGADEVARLAEMRADDVAAGRSGRVTLLQALVAMGTGQPLAAPSAALAATGGAVDRAGAQAARPAQRRQPRLPRAGPGGGARGARRRVRPAPGHLQTPHASRCRRWVSCPDLQV